MKNNLDREITQAARQTAAMSVEASDRNLSRAELVAGIEKTLSTAVLEFKDRAPQFGRHVDNALKQSRDLSNAAAPVAATTGPARPGNVVQFRPGNNGPSFN